MATEENKWHREELPDHLQRFVVDQYYERYTPVDQAVWRYILRQLIHYLDHSGHGHPMYKEGLDATGITVESIPRIENISRKMSEMGWKALPVSGFIPPAAFMEFQSLGFLPIASDMRHIDHIFYTPAPDIVHEAAGHAPIIADIEYANYLKKYAEVARNAIISHEDLALYEAIRDLSDMKESSDATKEDVKKAEDRLNEVIAAMSFVSEASYLGRMNWWTAEYGLYGDMKKPKIYGAGLLSSLGECRSCLNAKVKKIPLTLDCINYSYDITEPQPQLFVVKNCVQLEEVLEELAQTMAFRRGGVEGLEKALQAQTVNTVQLSSGIQISGKLTSIKKDESDQPIYIGFTGPSQLSYERKQLEGHSPDFHHAGYSTALGLLAGHDKPLEDWSATKLKENGLVVGNQVELDFASGVKVSGHLLKVLTETSKNILMTFDDCTVTYGDETLFAPDWGIYDMALGVSIPSVFGGPADSTNYPLEKSFAVKVIPLRKYNDDEKRVHAIYQQVRQLRETGDKEKFSPQKLYDEMQAYPNLWLTRLELLEVLRKTERMPDLQKTVTEDLEQLAKKPDYAEQIRLGLEAIDDLPLIFK